MRLISIFCLLIFCWACEGNTAARKAARGPNFVPDANHLYFKNTRAWHYRAEEVTNRATIFRHDDLLNSTAHLLPVIIDNWLQDRAVIRFEVRPEVTDWNLQVVRQNGRRDTVALSVPPANEELTNLATILLGNDELYLHPSPDTALLAFPDAPGRAAARVVLLDYLRLVGQ